MLERVCLLNNSVHDVYYMTYTYPYKGIVLVLTEFHSFLLSGKLKSSICLFYISTQILHFDFAELIWLALPSVGYRYQRSTLYDECRMIEVTHTILLCKTKRQYLLTREVRRYCLFVLHDSVVNHQMSTLSIVCRSVLWK